MKVETTNIKGILVINIDSFKDERGYFYESYNQRKYADLGIPSKFVQDNVSKSSQGTIRGLHYQVGEYAQGKLCQVIFGRVLDVSLDIRFGSPTFGKYFTIELSDADKKQIWIPHGFAHGFSVLSDFALFHYKCTNVYSKQHERSIIFSDPDINIDWKVESTIISSKDLTGRHLKEIDKDFIYHN